MVSQTWLTQPGTLLAAIARLVGKRRQRLAEFDDIAIAVFPFVEEGEVVADRLDRLVIMRRI